MKRFSVQKPDSYLVKMKFWVFWIVRDQEIGVAGHQEDVFRLDVAVNHVSSVQVPDGCQDLVGEELG